jgi:hypothetical protein
MPSISSQELTTISKSTIPIEHLENIKEDNNEALKRSKSHRNLKSYGEDFIVCLVDDTFNCISEAYASLDVDYWKSVSGEMESILANGTWKMTDHTYVCQPVGCMWVFKKKLRPDDTIKKYKAQLVADSCTIQHLYSMFKSHNFQEIDKILW